MSISYVIGDATQPIGSGNKVLVHVCNDVGGWGRGFVMALSARWAAPEREYRKWHRENHVEPFELGRVQFVSVGSDLWVANLIGQHDIHPRDGLPPVRYEAIRQGLSQVREFARTHLASVHMPRIGAGLAGGRWEAIEAIVESELSAHGLSVTVYDLDGSRSLGV